MTIQLENIEEFPPLLLTGMITHRLLISITDREDPDQEPDIVGVPGEVIFRANVDYVTTIDGEGRPVTLGKGPIRAVYNDEGYLCTANSITSLPMYEGVNLHAGDDPNASVQDYSWTASFNLKSVNGTLLKIPPATFQVPAGSEQDLSTIIKIPSTPGWGLPQSELAARRAEAAAASASSAAISAEESAEASLLALETMVVANDNTMTEVASDPNSLFAIKINSEITQTAGPIAEEAAAAYIGSQPSIVDAAAAAVNANPKIAQIEGRELPNRGRLLPADYPGGIDTVSVQGVYAIWSNADAAALMMPFALAGTVYVYPYGSSLQNLYYAHATNGVFELARRRSGGVWNAWRNPGLDDVGIAGLIATDSATRTSLRVNLDALKPLKTVAFALSTGNSGGVSTKTDDDLRYPIKVAADVEEFRVHIANINPRYGNKYPGALSFKGLGLGRHAGETDVTKEGQIVGPITTIVDSFTTHASGIEYVSPWVTNKPIKGYSEYLLTGGYTCAPQNNFAGVAGGWTTGDSNNWNVAAPAGLTLSPSLPFFVWLELRVADSVTVVAWPGDSLASGVSARIPMFDSMPNKHGLAHGYIPTSYANSGTSMVAHSNPLDYKWTRYDSAAPAKPNAVQIQMMSNDVFETGVTLAELKIRLAAFMTVVTSKLSHNVAFLLCLPRHNASSPQEPVRKLWNQFLISEAPYKPIAVTDTATPLTNPDGSTLNQMYSASFEDIHLTSGGYLLCVSNVPPLH